MRVLLRGLKIGILGLGLLVYTLAFSELFVRVFLPQPIMPRNVEGNADGIRGNIPNAIYRQTTPETDVLFHINSVGMRDDREFAFDKKPGLCRIELYGDSFFMGYELNYPDTIAARLEERLRAQGFNVEVLNFAVSGSGTAEALITLEKRGLAYRPDIVVFEWHSSTFFNNTRSELFRIDQNGLQRWKETYLPSEAEKAMVTRWPIIKYISDHSQLYALLRNKMSILIKRNVSERGSDLSSDRAKYGDLVAIMSSYSIDLSRALLLQARDLAAAHGADFAIADIPFNVKNDMIETVNALKLDGETKLIRPGKIFKDVDASGRSFYYQRGMNHFTPLGADMVAKMIADWAAGDKRLSQCRSEGFAGAL